MPLWKRVSYPSRTVLAGDAQHSIDHARAIATIRADSVPIETGDHSLKQVEYATG